MHWILTMIIDKPLAKDGNRSWKVTTDPATEPVTVDAMKIYGRIDGTVEDDYLTALVKSVRAATEKYLGRALISQSITLSMDYWPSDMIELPRPPLISITSIQTLDEDDVATTYDASNYFADTVPEPGRLVIKQDGTWPTNTARIYGGYRIVFKAGYGTDAADVPGGIKDGIMYWVLWCYENRVPVVKPPALTMSLFNPYRMMRI